MFCTHRWELRNLSKAKNCTNLPLTLSSSETEMLPTQQSFRTLKFPDRLPSSLNVNILLFFRHPLQDPARIQHLWRLGRLPPDRLRMQLHGLRSHLWIPRGQTLEKDHHGIWSLFVDSIHHNRVIYAGKLRLPKIYLEKKLWKIFARKYHNFYLFFAELLLVHRLPCHGRRRGGQLLHHRPHHHQRHVRQGHSLKDVGLLLLRHSRWKVRELIHF